MEKLFYLMVVKKLKSSMRKRALKEVTPISSIYNDTLVDIVTNYEDVDVAQKMPTFAVVKSSLYRSHQKRCGTIFHILVHNGSRTLDSYINAIKDLAVSFD